MITSRIAVFAVAVGLLGMVSLASAKSKGGGGGAGMGEYAKGNQFFEAKQYDQAIAEFTKAIAAGGKQPAFYANRGFAFVALGKGAEANSDFSQAIELAPKDERAYIGRVQALLKDRKIVLELTDAAKRWLGRVGYDPVYGARPLKRAVQRYLQDPLAEKLLGGEVPDGSTVQIDEGDGALTMVVR